MTAPDEALRADQVERLARVLPVLARGQKRHPDTSAAMTALGRLLRMCARCGEVPVLGGPDDLTLCDRCAADVGYRLGRADALREAAEQLDRDGMKRMSAKTVKQWLRARADVEEGRA